MDTRNQWKGLVAACAVAGLGIAAVICGALIPDDYWTGTPTTAKVDHCEYHGFATLDSVPDMYCRGTWSLNGQPQSGPIKPPFRGTDEDGIVPGKSVLDVHVRDGAAYTDNSAGKYLYFSLALGAGLLLWGSVWLRRIWARRRSPAT